MFSMLDTMTALDEIDAEIARQEAEDAQSPQIAALIDLTERYGFPAPIDAVFRRPGIPVPQMAPLAEKPHLCERNRCRCV